ncbi:Uncharacterised protein (plasmid) [Tsukamurella tyrosinosolvens]|uniref:Uncharacterized protein n=1 Tax=Tsukamurella tyrosinosolvens TaxID=57704 RepID=A0A1H4UIZ7_TSUTY|nr:hypothetical protein [Tsukamurella tyrosinosolvens]KXO92903.1 hypothetical protein AXK58_13595 [Tsukamurella tyrosinosolvens]SEC68647.1 hypothetical protein SAMN04489793_2919 [Tsukamurella tyrosinosolvens]VEH94260.1 Uncharacterised protein [Tsukamurella tyrosinosolvens]
MGRTKHLTPDNRDRRRQIERATGHESNPTEYRSDRESQEESMIKSPRCNAIAWIHSVAAVVAVAALALVPFAFFFQATSGPGEGVTGLVLGALPLLGTLALMFAALGGGELAARAWERSERKREQLPIRRLVRAVPSALVGAVGVIAIVFGGWLSWWLTTHNPAHPASATATGVVFVGYGIAIVHAAKVRAA